MDKKQILVGVVVLLIGVSLGGLFFRGSESVDERLKFEDVEISSDENSLAEVASGYITLSAISADEDVIADLVGSVVIRNRDGAKDEWTYNHQFRPSRDQIKTSIVNEQIFHGIVSAKTTFGGHFEIVSGGGGAEEIAETTISNQLIVGYKDSSDIPFQELSKLRLSPEMDFFFVERVVVTTITSKRFRRHSGTGKIEGMALGANGDVYVNRDAQLTRRAISFRPIALSALQASEAGAGDDFAQLKSKARREKLSADEARELVDHLNSKTSEIAPSSSPVGRPQASLPDKLRAMKAIVWINDLTPIRQSSQNRCWAATMAMLMAWQERRVIGEREATASIGPQWERVYDRDIPLPKDYKFALLKAAGFDYAAPQSYAPQGLKALLESYGPIWFTIDKAFGRHATVLTGLFLEPAKDDYWVSYIDPADGTLHADTYASYMHRYEAPAYRANEEDPGLVETEEDLDIQVIHL